MAKISRPVLYTVVGSIAAYAIFLYTQPDAPSGKHPARYTINSHVTADANGILPEDLHARFPRYHGGKRDPFVPQVVVKSSVASAPKSAFGNSRSGWSLTGINVVNGVASALIENSASNDSVFLQPGDRWNGLRVVSVDSDKVVFDNALGQQTRLTFAEPPADGSDKSGNPGTSGSPNTSGGAIPPLPTFGSIRPLPPLAPAPPNGASPQGANAAGGTTNQ